MYRSWRTTHEFFTTCGPHDRAQAIRLAQKCSLAQLAILLALFNFFDLPYRVMGFIIALVVFCLFCILRQKVLLYNLAVLELTMETRLAWHSHRSACLCLRMLQLDTCYPPNVHSHTLCSTLFSPLPQHLPSPCCIPPLAFLSHVPLPHWQPFISMVCVFGFSVMPSDPFETGFLVASFRYSQYIINWTFKFCICY